MRRYLYNLLIAADQFVNVIFLGDPDETISSRLGKWARAKGRDDLPHSYPATWLYWFLDGIDYGHSEDAIEEDEGRNQIGKW
jgi:hypothetical protein